MTESIHGHDVMRMMVEANRAFTEGQLKEAIAAKFGKDARFHTCSASEMTAEDLIGFLRARSKFIVSDDTVAMKAENICDHE
ncbi:MAG: YecH family protein [Elusimicrobia bacterium]|jgi:probable metal-binding protein|nr:YecH family protein [Elusimicrobiota bacterium]